MQRLPNRLCLIVKLYLIRPELLPDIHVSLKKCTKIVHFYYICLIIYYNPMNTQTPRQEYLTPALRIIPIYVENAICDSTIPGGNEDIGYEDWD